MTKPSSTREILTETIDSIRTEYRGIAMRSKLEAEFAAWLDAEDFDWLYEPRIFGPVGEGYLPDFFVRERGDRCYIEIKPTLEKANDAKARMKVIWMADPDAVLVMVSGDGWWQVAVRNRPGWESWREHWHGYKAK